MKGALQPGADAKRPGEAGARFAQPIAGVGVEAESLEIPGDVDPVRIRAGIELQRRADIGLAGGLVALERLRVAQTAQDPRNEIGAA